MTLGEAELREGFAAFIAASQRLEESYRALQARAAAVDLELAETNRRLQQALAEREAVFGALPLGVVALRADGAETFRNREAERLCGVAAAHGVDLLQAEPGKRDIHDAVVKVRRVDLPDGCLVLLEDCSRMTELEREVNRLDRLAGLSELALGVAHEIKNPLNGVMGFAALLARNPDPASCRRHAERITEGLGQVDRIVKALLAFARPDGRRGPALPIALLVADAVQSAGLRPGGVRLLGARELRAEGDALARVLAILFRNSVEAGGAEVNVTVQAAAVDGWLELQVRDDGPGIAPGLGVRVFEPFVSSKERGTGLGLPLAARVLSFLGGEVRLVDAGPPGACFRVRVPLAAAAPAAEPAVPAAVTA